MRSDTLSGQVLRVLVRRLKMSVPAKDSEPYSDEDVQILLLVTLAEAKS